MTRAELQALHTAMAQYRDLLASVVRLTQRLPAGTRLVRDSRLLGGRA